MPQLFEYVGTSGKLIIIHKERIFKGEKIKTRQKANIETGVATNLFL